MLRLHLGHTDNMIKLIKNQITNETFFICCKTISEIGRLMKERGDVFGLSENTYQSIYRVAKDTMGPRHLRLMDTVFLKTANYFLTRKYTPRLRELSRHIGFLRDTGVINMFMNKFIPFEADVRYAKPRSELNIDNTIEPLQMQHYYTISSFFCRWTFCCLFLLCH